LSLVSPASWPLSNAHPRQGVRTGHPAHTSLAWPIWSNAGRRSRSGSTTPDRCRATPPHHTRPRFRS